MPVSAEPRVALYFDFDNIVISRYDQLHGDSGSRRVSAYRKDTSTSKAPVAGSETAKKLAAATVDVDAVLDFAATFGTIAIARAYADWSTPVNASYRGQLIDRAVDLVQLFPLSATKNGADIRLAVDAVEDMFRIDDLTHIVIVAGDSDYVALAQKAKRLGRYVIGIGVAGGTSRALTAACDEYADYDTLLATDAAVSDDEAADAAAEATEATAPATG
ncbi:MAG: NYN domain-containing protein, partial [Agromyces sp.]